MHHGACLGQRFMARDTQSPIYYPITGQYVFPHGCLHWLVTDYEGRLYNDILEVICFDVIGEEFWLINPPKTKGSGPITFYYLSDLHGEVGYVRQTTHKIEVWVLKMKEWTMHFQLDQDASLHCQIPRVLGRWNKEKGHISEITRF